MSHAPKVVSLAAVLLLFQSGISLAAPPDPTKQISPSQQPPLQLNPCLTKPCPDLVPWKGGMGGGIGVKNFGCSNTVSDPYVLKITLGIRNSGTAQTTVPVKTLAKINGAVWNNPNNPRTTAAGMSPNGWQEFSMNGAVPAPGTYTLEVKVDSDNAQLESKENNNVTTATTTCR